MVVSSSSSRTSDVMISPSRGKAGCSPWSCGFEACLLEFL
jgi:hypothetical protein